MRVQKGNLHMQVQQDSGKDVGLMHGRLHLTTRTRGLECKMMQAAAGCFALHIR